MSVLRRVAALQDLIDLAHYIALDNVEAAYQFLDKVEESFRDLERMPLMGSSRDFQNPVLEGIRLWRVKDFPKHLIFYRPIKDGVEIIRVLHSARDIAGLFSGNESASDINKAMATNQKTFEGFYKEGKVELLETPDDVDEARVIVTFIPEDSVDLAPRDIDESQAANLLACRLLRRIGSDRKWEPTMPYKRGEVVLVLFPDSNLRTAKRSDGVND